MDSKCIIDPERDCLGLIKAENLEKKIDEYRQTARETHSELFERINALEKSDSARNQQYLNIIDKLNTLTTEITKANNSVAEMLNKPAKKWENISEKVIWAILAACIGYILSQIGIV